MVVTGEEIAWCLACCISDDIKYSIYISPIQNMYVNTVLCFLLSNWFFQSSNIQVLCFVFCLILYFIFFNPHPRSPFGGLTSLGLIAFFGSWVRTNFWTLRARPRELSSRVLGLLSMYCTVHMWLFFTIWIHSNTFCNFSGRSHLIFKCLILYIFISFLTPYSKLFYDKNSWRYSEKKKESLIKWLGFSSEFGFIQTFKNISRFLGL